jgi:trehalose synthase
MIEEVKLSPKLTLDDYASYAHLANTVAELRSEAGLLSPKLSGRTVWMINSTAKGGGVAEMLPHYVSLMNQIGVKTRWLVIGTDRTEFFNFTKKLHNLIHGAGEPEITQDELELYETVSRELADELRGWVAPDDILVVHDPQPAGMGAKIAEELGVMCIWRCHIGLDAELPQTRVAWDFLKPYIEQYDQSVWTATEYIPHYLSSNVAVIHPSIDPLSHKNRELSAHKLIGVLCNSALLRQYGPVLTPPFETPVQRLKPDGSFAPATQADELGVPFRPIVTQISRWDRLKGWRPLLDAFVTLKRDRERFIEPGDDRHRQRLGIVRLVLAGPEPAAVQDDPEAKEVLDELCDAYKSLTPDLQDDVALLSLPMSSLKVNALMVNALQRCSTVVVQNSLREGFGLTATEAMWKRTPVLGSSACGLRQQIRNDIDGHLVDDPEDVHEVADALSRLLSDPLQRDALSRRAQRRVHDEFLVFKQVMRWIRLLASTVEPRRTSSRPASIRPLPSRRR